MIDSSSQFELQVCPNGRSKADEYYHQGSIWIEGREGSNYILRFINRSPNRVAVIFSVDGLDTIKGEPAGPNSNSYVVNANDSLEVPGWVLNDKQAAEFYFAKAGHQYVATSGYNTSNTGVIGAMVFKEKIQMNWSSPWPYYMTPGQFTLNHSNYNITRNASETSQMIAQAQAQSMSKSVSQDIGTGFGNATEFNTTNITFVRNNPSVPDAILAIYYNTAKNLEKMGIIIRTNHTRYDNSFATPFPNYTPGCKPPPGWTY